ncbi:MAG: shikimate kinase [Thermodesulfobacteriota bacterium]
MSIKDKNIVLIGYRATGKTSVGKIIAKKLNRPFVDSDHAVEKKAGQSISAMVEARGWNAFRTKEKNILLELTKKPGQIIACGGGAILHQDIWAGIKENSFVVWLKADIETIYSRLAADKATSSQRPSLSGQDIYQEVAEVLKERTPLYRHGCHLELDATGSMEDIVDKILTRFQGKS